MCRANHKAIPFVLAFLAAWGSPVMGVHFGKDGFVRVDETPRLIIGLYELPKSDAKLKEIAESGFNLVRVPQNVETLNRVWDHGLYAWICLGGSVQLQQPDADGERKLASIINTFKEHPALLVWELPDEALWNVWWRRHPWVFGGQQRQLRELIKKAEAEVPATTVTQWRSLMHQANDYSERGLWERAETIYDSLWVRLKVENPHPDWKMSQCPAESRRLIEATARGCRVVRRFDPNHPIWQNHAPRNCLGSLQEYNRMVDAAGCDIYPVPFNYGVGHSDVKDTNLSAVGAYTDRMSRSAAGKSIWMVLQGFGWRDISESDKDNPDPAKGRRPRYQETRFMAYEAIVQGAHAILYWGTHAIEKDSSLWQDLMKVARELRALEPAIVAERATVEPSARAEETYGSIDGQGPKLMLRRTGNDWVLLAVNEWAQGVSFSVTGLPAELEGKTLHHLYSEESHVVKNATIRDGMRGFGVHVYATSRRFEAR
ncbi:MAG: hypothetical protein JW741_21040 [Sedimentisphaerales bacterium]|nr:hypothetical protein [Sedimentisphaerales bacterium]